MTRKNAFFLSGIDEADEVRAVSRNGGCLVDFENGKDENSGKSEIGCTIDGR
jgi:hypothetical protein